MRSASTARHEPGANGVLDTRGLGRDGRASEIAKTFVIFALFAIPAGIVLSKMQARKQIQEEKAAFGHLGWDWNKR